jgi:hypothetical protein
MENIDLKVLGEAHPDKIILSLELITSADLIIQMYDMAGRIVYKKGTKGKAGHQEILLENTNVHPGMYVIRVMDERSNAVVKALVRYQ